MKKKILIFHPALAPYRVDFFNAIDTEFNAIFYFCLPNVPDQSFNQDELKRKCTFNVNYLKSGVDIKGRTFRFGIISLIIKEKPDIILCDEYGPVTVVVFLYRYFFKSKFKLYTISDDSIDNSKSRKGLRAIFRNVISKNIDGVLFPSADVCDWYNENISKKTKTIELPIIHNDEVFRRNLSNSLKIANENLDKYDLKKKKIILYVGRLVEVKNLEFLIGAVSGFKLSDWALVIVGDGMLMDELKESAKNLQITDKVIFIGRKEGAELVSWYTIADLFVLPSIHEPYGAVVNEALLGGCKVLCSELAGASSLINKNNGKTFNPYSIEELTIYLTEYLNEMTFVNDKVFLRDSLMPFTFLEKINKCINDLY